MDIQQDYLKWALYTFDTTALSAIIHLDREVDELYNEVLFDGEDPYSLENGISEVADIQMLLWYICQKLNISNEDLEKAIQEKLKINRKRTWIKNEDGSYSHVK